VTRFTTRSAVVFLGVTVALSGCGSHKSGEEKTVARGSAKGTRASALVSGRAGPLQKVAVRVTATPAQQISGTWSVVCKEPPGITSRDGDTFAGRTPLTAPLRPLPRPGENAECTIVATGTLTRAGRVRVAIVGS
jgi:hypothetical protein